MIELLAALAVARVSVFIVRERAPLAIMEKIRQWLKVDTLPEYNNLVSGVYNQTTHKGGLEGLKKDLKPPVYELAYLLSCVWCISIWIGFLATFLLHQPWYYGLAYSAFAIFYDEKL